MCALCIVDFVHVCEGREVGGRGVVGEGVWWVRMWMSFLLCCVNMFSFFPIIGAFIEHVFINVLVIVNNFWFTL